MEGEKVVDLYGFAPETIVDGRTKNYDGDTLQVVASSGKNMEAIAVAMLVDRGLVRYEDPVQKHWPEFGANGKGQITIADVMRHAGGVPFVLESSSQTTTIPITTQDIFEVIPWRKRFAMPPNTHPPWAQAFATTPSPEDSSSMGFCAGLIPPVDRWVGF